MSMERSYLFGIDVGGTAVKCGLFDTEGNLLEKWELPTRREEGGRYILPDAAKSALEKARERGIAQEEVLGVGVGVPGPVDERGEMPFAVNLGWGYKNVSGEMEELTGWKSRAANDANVAALGELWRGGAQGYKNAVLLTLGTGIGGGIILNGKILAGSHGAGGELGHVHADDQETEKCNCGNRGCLEQVASATGIVRLARRELASCGDPSLLREGELSAKAVFDAVKQQDPVALRIAERFGEYMGKATAGFAAVVDPEVFVIGGGVSKAGTVLLDYIRKYYRAYAFPACRSAEFVLASLGNDAGIYGAARLLLD